MKKFYLPLVAGAMAIAVCCVWWTKISSRRESVELTGAGATFPITFL